MNGNRWKHQWQLFCNDFFFTLRVMTLAILPWSVIYAVIRTFFWDSGWLMIPTLAASIFTTYKLGYFAHSMKNWRRERP